MLRIIIYIHGAYNEIFDIFWIDAIVDTMVIHDDTFNTNYISVTNQMVQMLFLSMILNQFESILHVLSIAALIIICIMSLILNHCDMVLQKLIMNMRCNWHWYQIGHKMKNGKKQFRFVNMIYQNVIMYHNYYHFAHLIANI